MSDAQPFVGTPAAAVPAPLICALTPQGPSSCFLDTHIALESPQGANPCVRAGNMMGRGKIHSKTIECFPGLERKTNTNHRIRSMGVKR